MHNRCQLITSPLFPIEVKSGPAGRLRSIRVPLCYAGALNDQDHRPLRVWAGLSRPAPAATRCPEPL